MLKSSEKTDRFKGITNLITYYDSKVKTIILVVLFIAVGRSFVLNYVNLFVIPFLVIQTSRNNKVFLISYICSAIGLVLFFIQSTNSFVSITQVEANIFFVKYVTALSLIFIMYLYFRHNKISLNSYGKAFVSVLISIISSSVLLFYQAFSTYYFLAVALEALCAYILPFVAQEGIAYLTLGKIKTDMQLSERKLLSLSVVYLVFLFSTYGVTAWGVSVQLILLFIFLAYLGYITNATQAFFISFLIIFLTTSLTFNFNSSFITLFSLTTAITSLVKKNKSYYALTYLVVFLFMYFLLSEYLDGSFNTYFLPLTFALVIFMLVDLNLFNDISKKYVDLSFSKNADFYESSVHLQILKNSYMSTLTKYKSTLDVINKSYLKVNNTDNDTDELDVTCIECIDKNNKLNNSIVLVKNQLDASTQIIESAINEIDNNLRTYSKTHNLIQNELSKRRYNIVNLVINKIDNTYYCVEITIAKNHYILRMADEIKSILEKTLYCEFNEYRSESFDVYIKLIFLEKFNYTIDVSHKKIGKDNIDLSGDSFLITEKNDGVTLLAVSDGMGHGRDALMQSGRTLDILENLTSLNVDADSSISLVNSIMLLNNDNEVFSTLDIAEFNNYSGVCTFKKFGASTTYVFRKGTVQRISCKSLPVGIMNTIEPDVYTMNLFNDDIVLMVTDGIYEAAETNLDKDLWITNLLLTLQFTNIHQLTKMIMDKALELSDNNIPKDDMLVLGFKIKANK